MHVQGRPRPWRQWGVGWMRCDRSRTLTHRAGHYIVEAIAETGNLVAVDVMVSDFRPLARACAATCHACQGYGVSEISSLSRVHRFSGPVLGFSFSPMGCGAQLERADGQRRVANESMQRTMADIRRRSTRRSRTRCRRSRRSRSGARWRGQRLASRCCS